MTHRVLDWAPRFDEASRAYPARTLVQGPVTPRSYSWRCAPHLDQGREGACVGFGNAHFYASRRGEHPGDASLAQRIYRRAQQIDQWAGVDYEGTSVLAGVKAAQEFGLVRGYRWCFSLEESLQHLSRMGGLVVGTNWYENMHDVDSNGFLSVSGPVVGGHCYLVKGVSFSKRRVTVHNSWGPDWGLGGDAYLTFEDFGRLIREQGEVCAPLKSA